MRSWFQRAASMACAVLVTLSTVTLGALPTRASGEEWVLFTGVNLTQPDGSALPDLTERDAQVLVELAYALPAHLPDGDYAFALPQVVTANCTVQMLDIPVGADKTATVRIGENGDCVFTIVSDADTPPADEEDELLPPVDAGDEFLPPTDEEVDALPSVDEEVDSLPSADAEVDSLPSADAEVDSLPPVDAEVDSLPSDDEEVDALPPVDEEVDSLPSDDEEVESLPSDDEEVESLPPVDEEVESMPPVDEEGDSLPSADEEGDSSLPLKGSFTFETTFAPEYLAPDAHELIFFAGSPSEMAVLVPFAPAGGLLALAPRSLDFSGNFTSVSMTKQDGSALPDPLPKDAAVRVVLHYTIPAGGLTTNTAYAFSLPPAVTGKIDAPIDIMLDSDKVGEVTVIPGTGACQVVFTEAEAVAASTDGFIYIATTLDKTKIGNDVAALTFDLGTSPPFTIATNFALDQIEGSVVVTNAASLDATNNRVKWTVGVTPTLKSAIASATNLKAFTISNVINDKLTLAFDSTDSATYPVIKKNGTAMVDMTWDYDSGTLTCKLADASWTAGDKYEIVYYTNYDLGVFKDSDDAGKLINKASAQFQYAQYAENSGSSSSTINEGAKTANHNNVEASAEIRADLLSKESAYIGRDHQITWTVKTNGATVAFNNAYPLTDVIPKGLKLLRVTVDGTPSTTHTYTGSDYSGGTLTIPNLTATAPHTIVYVTEIQSEIWQAEPSRTFENKVTYTGKYGTPGTDYTFTRIVKKRM